MNLPQEEGFFEFPVDSWYIDMTDAKRSSHHQGPVFSKAKALSYRGHNRQRREGYSAKTQKTPRRDEMQEALLKGLPWRSWRLGEKKKRKKGIAQRRRERQEERECRPSPEGIPLALLAAWREGRKKGIAQRRKERQG